MAAGTLAQHATGTWTAMLLDHAGMQSANVAMVLIGLRRWYHIRWSTLCVLGAVAWCALVPLTAALEDVRRLLVVGGMLPCGLIELRLYFRDGSETSYRWWAAAWLAFAGAVAAWHLDQRSAWCHRRTGGSCTPCGTCSRLSESPPGQPTTLNSTRYVSVLG